MASPGDQATNRANAAARSLSAKGVLSPKVPQAATRLPRRQAGRWTRAASLDHLVGAGDEGRRHLKAEGLRWIEIDHQLEFGRLQHG